MNLDSVFVRYPAREGVVLWAVAVGAILTCVAVVPDFALVVATTLFLVLPQLTFRARGQSVQDLGLRAPTLRRDILPLVAALACSLPLYGIGAILMRQWMATPTVWWTWPALGLVIHQLVVVALPEEFFYRGYLQTRFREAWPQGPLLWGARLGPAFWLPQFLFALGHLAQPAWWRLAVMFPALVMGWLRERTGGLFAPIVFHAAANLVALGVSAAPP